MEKPQLSIFNQAILDLTEIEQIVDRIIQGELTDIDLNILKNLLAGMDMRESERSWSGDEEKCHVKRIEKKIFPLLSTKYNVAGYLEYLAKFDDFGYEIKW